MADRLPSSQPPICLARAGDRGLFSQLLQSMRLPRLKAYVAVLRAVFLRLDPEIKSQLNTTAFADKQCLICVSGGNSKDFVEILLLFYDPENCLPKCTL